MQTNLLYQRAVQRYTAYVTRFFRLSVAASGNYPLPKIGPPWYTADLRRDLLKKSQIVFGLAPTGVYDKALFDRVSEAQQQLGLPVNGIIDNIMLELIGLSPVAADKGWPETVQKQQQQPQAPTP